MKILHVLGDSKYGGAAKNIIRLAQFWNSAGWDACILTTDPLFQKACGDAAVEVIALDCIWKQIRPLQDVVGLFKLWRFLRKARVTIVHTHTTKAGFIGRIAAALAGVPIIIHTVHGFAFHERSSRAKIAFYTLIERIAACFCHRITTVSKFHGDWAQSLGVAGFDKLQVIPNGVPDIRDERRTDRRDVRASLSVPDEDIMLFTHGRLTLEKGLEDLLEAVAATRGRLSRRMHVVIAGEGPLLAALEQSVHVLGLADQVRFLGFRQDIGALLSAADIVVLPSLREGLSIALLEAMSAGRAIIATSIGSNLEAVGGASPAAILVESEDSRALADAIVGLAGNAGLRETLGNRARIRWEREYTMERSHCAYVETYQELLRRRRPFELVTAGHPAISGSAD